MIRLQLARSPDFISPPLRQAKNGTLGLRDGTGLENAGANSTDTLRDHVSLHIPRDFVASTSAKKSPNSLKTNTLLATFAGYPGIRVAGGICARGTWIRLAQSLPAMHGGGRDA